MRPLEDVRILAIEQYGAGPFATMHLAELGAEVIKLEEPSSRGDVGRYVPPFQEGENSLFFETYNRNKRSLSLDIRNPAGRAVFEALVEDSDAVFSNLRGDVPARLGLRYDDLKHINSSIVCCSLSGFGMTGSLAAQPAYDYLIQGMAGWMSLTGDPDGPPAKTGLSLVDWCGGYVASVALLAGIHAARRDHQGMDCDLSLYDSAVSLLGYVATWHLTGDFVPTRLPASAHPSLVPFQNFETADGWIVVACAKEKFWLRLVAALGRTDLADDPRFGDFEARRAHRDELIEILAGIFRTQTTVTWLEQLGDAGVPSGPVRSVPQVFEDPLAMQRGMIVETAHPRFGTVRSPASPVRVGSDHHTHRRAPQRHEDVDWVMRTILGHDSTRIDELSAAGAFGPPELPLPEGTPAVT